MGFAGPTLEVILATRLLQTLAGILIAGMSLVSCGDSAGSFGRVLKSFHRRFFFFMQFRF